MKKISHSIVLIVLAGFVPCASALAADPVIVSQSGATTRIGNDYLQQTVQVNDEVVGTTRFLNKLSNRVYSVWGDEFQITLSYEGGGNRFGLNGTVLTNKDFTVENESVQNLANQGKRVIYRLSLRRGSRGEGPKLEVDLVYELLPSEFYIRKWLDLKVTGTGALFIDSVAVASNHWSVQDFRLGGYGQPLFADDLFMGLEYPASVNTAQNSIISLERNLGRDISSEEGYTSDPVVIGVADKDDQVHQAFMQYVSQIRVGPVGPYFLYNTWYDLRRPYDPRKPEETDDTKAEAMTQQSVLDRLHQLQDLLLKPYGLRLNSFVLDEGWDNVNDLWTINRQEFPDGFGPLVAALKAAHSRLGMWFGPMGGYNYLPERIAAGRRIGMEVMTDDRGLCLAGTNYSRFFRDRFLHFQETYGVNFFKYDGISMGCNAFGQGYPPGLYSREWNIQSVIDSANAVRANDPGVFLRIGGSSPWSLRWSNIGGVGGGETCGGDYGYLYMVPTLSSRQSELSCINMSNYEGLVLQKTQFPMSSTEGTGLILGQESEVAGLAHVSLQDWDDAVVDYVSDGGMVFQMFITPGMLTPGEWSALGHSLQWFDANAHPVLDNTTMVLGDPIKREPYGYVHYSPAKTIISLRNPYVQPRSVTLSLDTDAGFESSTGVWTAEVIYPYRETLPGTFHFGSTLTTELGAYELQLIELQPVEKDQVRISGLRYTVEASQDSGVDLMLYAPAGATKAVSIPTAQVDQNVRVDGKSVDLQQASDQAALSLHFGDLPHPDQPSFTEPSIAVQQEANGARIAEVSFTVEVPHDFSEARLALLFEPSSLEPGVTAEARDNGKLALVQTVQQLASPDQVRPSGKSLWYFFTLGLSPGRHAVDFTIRMPETATGPIKLSGWLLGKRTLASHRLQLTLKPGMNSAAPRPDLLPHSSEIARETYALFSHTL